MHQATQKSGDDKLVAIDDSQHTFSRVLVKANWPFSGVIARMGEKFRKVKEKAEELELMSFEERLSRRDGVYGDDRPYCAHCC